MLDEELEKLERNKELDAKRKEIEEEAEKLEEELAKLKEEENDINEQLKNKNNTPEEIAELKGKKEANLNKQNKNQDSFSKNCFKLEEHNKKENEIVHEDEIEELKQNIGKYNKICEAILEGKSISEIIELFNTRKPEEKENKEKIETNVEDTDKEDIQREPIKKKEIVQEQPKKVESPIINSNVEKQKGNMNITNGKEKKSDPLSKFYEKLEEGFKLDSSTLKSDIEQEVGKKNDIEWNTKLTSEQIEELIEQGIKPGDNEYDQYLWEHAINHFEEAKTSEIKDSEGRDNKENVENIEEKNDNLFEDIPLVILDDDSKKTEMEDVYSDIKYMPNKKNICGIYIDASYNKIKCSFVENDQIKMKEKNLAYEEEDYKKCKSIIRRYYWKNLNNASTFDMICKKADPNIISFLDEIGEPDMLRGYIATIKSPESKKLPFELTYNLKDMEESELSKNEKKKINEVTKHIKQAIGKENIEQDNLMTKIFNNIKCKLFTPKEKLLSAGKTIKENGKNSLGNLFDTGNEIKEKSKNHIKHSKFVDRYKAVVNDVVDAIIRSGEDLDEKENPEKSDDERGE